MTDPAADHPLLAAALDWHAAGYCVVPTHEDGGKRPFGPWARYQHQRPSTEDLRSWLADGRYTGIGVITGAVSGNVEMIELEAEAISNGSIEFVHVLAERAGTASVWRRALAGCAEQSGGEGLHLFVRVTDGPALPNTKLARRLDRETGEMSVLAETRGEGGFVVVAPTPPRTGHQRVYAFIPGTSPTATAEVTSAERDELHRLLACLDDVPEAHQDPPRAAPAAPRDGLTPGDDYAARTPWADILVPHGWVPVWTGTRNGHPQTAWRRPGKADGISATTGGAGDWLYVFTTSTTLPAEQPLSKLFVHAHLEHGGDMAAAARALAAAGFGERRDDPLRLQPFVLPTGPPPGAAGDGAGQDGDGEPGPSWADLGWLLTGERRDPPPPVWLGTEHGTSLFYAARINGLFGDPETAKSWIAMCAIVDALDHQQPCAYLDVDHNGANEIAARLLALGAHPTDLADPGLFRIYEPEDGAGLLSFVAEMLQWRPEVVVVDSLGEIVPMLGLKSSDNDELTRAIRAILKPLAHVAGACVIAIDHLPKSQEARTSGYAIGGIAKKRAVDGSYLSCEAIAPPAPGHVGKIRLTVEKDRHGHVRSAAVGRIAGDFILDSSGPDSIMWRVEVPSAGADGKEKPTGAMEKVSRWLEEQGMVAPSRNAIVKALQNDPFKKATLDRAIDQLAADGYLLVMGDGGRRSAHPVRLTGAFREFGGGL